MDMATETDKRQGIALAPPEPAKTVTPPPESNTTRESPLASNTLLRVRSNDVIASDEKALADSKKLQEEPMVQNLAGYIQSRFEDAERVRLVIKDKMLEATRRRRGVYNPDLMAEIQRQGGSELYVKLTETMCLNAEAWIGDVAQPQDGRPWALEPEPDPELPPEIAEKIVQDTVAAFSDLSISATPDEIRQNVTDSYSRVMRVMERDAQTRADNMSKRVERQLLDGGFSAAVSECISDAVTVGTGIMKGPFLQMEKQLKWLKNKGYAPDITEDAVMKFRRVDPFYVFPAPGSVGTDKATCPYICEVDEFTRSSLRKMRGVDGWSTENINTLLKESPHGFNFTLTTDAERAYLQDRQQNEISQPFDKFRGIWYHGEIPGHLLKEWGMTGIEVEEEYECIALKIGRFMLHCRLNQDPLGRRNYFKWVYKPVKGSFWGQGVPELMNDIQDICNATARHMCNNLSMASGPMVAIYELDNLAEGQDINGVYPGRVWQFNRPAGVQGKPMEFFQPSANTDVLIKCFDYWLSIAEKRMGIPVHNSKEGTGGLNTATGISILMNQASRLLKQSIAYLDAGIIKPLIEAVITWNMIYLDEPMIKGDVRVIADGAMGLFVKEQEQMRITELLRETANPIDMGIIGNQGRAELLRASTKGLGNVRSDDVVPTRDELDERQKQQEQAAQMQAQQQAMNVPGNTPAPAAGVPAAAG